MKKKLIEVALTLEAIKGSTRSLARFNLGESVCFTDPGGKERSGRIVRLNKKTATILTTDGGHWNGSPNFLKSAEEK